MSDIVRFHPAIVWNFVVGGVGILSSPIFTLAYELAHKRVFMMAGVYVLLASIFLFAASLTAAKRANDRAARTTPADLLEKGDG